MSIDYRTEWKRKQAEREAKTPRTFKSADQLLQGRNHQTRKIANNTYLERRGSSIAVKLHNTDVITYHPDGSMTLSTGGWNTMTTRDRIHRFTPTNVRMYQLRGISYLKAADKDSRFFDGIVIGPRGAVKNPMTKSKSSKVDKLKAKINKQIKEYVAGWIECAVTGQMPLPSSGDCWYCLGLLHSSDSHLHDHMEEKYYVPSLIVLAATAKGYQNPQIALTYICGLSSTDGERFDGAKVNIKEIQTLLTWYLRKHLRNTVA